MLERSAWMFNSAFDAVGVITARIDSVRHEDLTTS